ncbi:MAG TPA: shikimate kinase [Tepidisphaeraceae bacterium]|nr:shikimate kinase [Tepidisphaeraceae bacterium]
MSVVLIGYRCSGKTTVGRLLASRLGRPFVDSDDRIVGLAGKSIRDIFAERGEEGFRDLETRIVEELAALPEHVIALGGGALNRAENRKAFAACGHRIIYLRCEPAELLRRINADPNTAQSRPALTALGGGIEEIEKLLARREPIWKQMCSAELDVTHLPIEQAVAEVAKLA